MEAIINFLYYFKAILNVKLGVIAIAIEWHKAQKFVAEFDESRFYPDDLKPDVDDDHSDVNGINIIAKPGFYLSWTDAASNGCLLGPKDDGPGLYY